MYSHFIVRVRSSIPMTLYILNFPTGLIDNDRIGVYFEPTVGADNTNGTGQLDLGDVDSSKIYGSITYTAITSTSPASTFWGIDQRI